MTCLFSGGCALHSTPEYTPSEQDIQELKAADWAAKAADMKFDNTFSDPGKAFTYLTKAIELDSDEPYYYYNRALATQLLGRTQDAIDDLTAAIALDTDFKEAIAARAFFYKALGNNDKAIEDFSRLIALDANLELVYLNRGVLYYLKGNVPQSIADFTQTIALNPAQTKAYSLRAECYIKQNQLQKAAEDLSTAINLNPRNSDYYLQRGLLNEHLGKEAQALADFQEVYTQQPDNLSAAMALARMAATAKDKTLRNPSLAIPAARKAVKLTKRKNPLCLQLLAATLAAAGKYRLAELSQREAIRLYPKTTSAKNQTERAKAEFLLNRYKHDQEFTPPPGTAKEDPFNPQQGTEGLIRTIPFF